MDTTTKEGFLMNTLRRAPRIMVKAVAAGAMLVAATLPLAIATEAGAATIPPASYLTLTQTGGVPFQPGSSGTAAAFGPGFAGTATLVFSAADSASLANAATSATVTTTATGVTFGGGVESVNTATQVVASISSASTAATGFYPVTVTDTTGSVTIPNAIFIDPAATIVTLTPSTLPVNDTLTVTLTGTGFISGATAQLALSGTILTSSSGGTTNPALSTLTYVNPTTLSGTVNTTAVTTGLYVVSVSNGDGGSVSSTTVGLTVTGPTITSVAPQSLAIPAPGSAATTTTITLTGTGFQSGSYVSLVPYINAPYTTGTPTATAGVSAYVSNTSITVPITVPSTSPAGQFTVIEHNPDGSSAQIIGGLGIGEASSAPAVVTSVGTLPAMSIGSSASLLITGTGFGAGSTTATVTFLDTAGLADTDVTCTPTVISDTQISCIIHVNAGAKSGPHSVVVLADGGSVASAPLKSALTVNGMAITSVLPAAVNANFDGVFTLTGTGFISGDTYTATVAGQTTAGTTTAVTPAFVSTTSMTVTVTGSTIAAGQFLTITLHDSTAGTTTDIAVPVIVIPTTTSITYVTGTTGIGVGAAAQPITIVGTGFLPGALVTFPAASGVSAKVVLITPTAIQATIAVAAGSPTGTAALTVTNTNGGSNALATIPLTVDAGPGTLVSAPTAVLSGAKAATITITGVGIEPGATVTSSSPLVTIAAVVAKAGSVTFTASSPAVTGTVNVNLTLSVNNADGGSSSVAFIVNPGPTVTGAYFVPTGSTNLEVNVTGTGFEQGLTVTSSNAAYSVQVAAVNATGNSLTLLVTTTSAATAGTNSNIVLTNPDGSAVTFVLNGGPKPKPAPTGPHAVRVVGSARVGKTVTITILGMGFYGQPRIVSNDRGTRATVSHDSGTSLTVRITETKAAKKGLHVLKITLANGKSTNVKYIVR